MKIGSTRTTAASLSRCAVVCLVTSRLKKIRFENHVQPEKGRGKQFPTGRINKTFRIIQLAPARGAASVVPRRTCAARVERPPATVPIIVVIIVVATVINAITTIIITITIRSCYWYLLVRKQYMAKSRLSRQYQRDTYAYCFMSV